MNEFLERIDRAWPQVTTLANKVAKRDLMKMISTIDKKITQIDQELVECRRLRKETVRYLQLKQEAQDMLDNLEKHITFAALIG